MTEILDAANIIESEMRNIDYGWIDKYGIKHLDVDSEFSDNYFLRSPEQIIESQVGICWDQVEVERCLFSKYNIAIETFFIVNYDGRNYPSHTWLIFKDNGCYYWFEHSWGIHRGVHRYESKKELIYDVYNKFKLSNCVVDDDQKSLVIYQYSKPDSGLSALEFYNHCEGCPVVT